MGHNNKNRTEKLSWMKKDKGSKFNEWKLYRVSKDKNEFENAYDIWKKSKNKNTHFGLQMDKFMNIFNLQGREINSKDSLKTVHENIENILKLDTSLYEIIDIKATSLDKLIVGLGGHSVFETDIKVHHTYGVPYIPGSAVKGCLRNYIISEYFDSNEKDAEKDFNFIRIFGGEYKKQAYKGNVIFLDAFPVCNNQDKINVVKDIMTPHYDYANNNYRDDATITPISFLVVKNLKFRFPIKFRINTHINEENDKTNLKYTREFLEEKLIEMLENHGIGAKTSVGYGFFDFREEDNSNS